MYKLIRVRRKPRARCDGRTVLRCVIYLSKSWQEKRVYVVDAKAFNRIIVERNKLRRKIKNVIKILK